MLGADVTLIAICLAAGAVGALTLEHGWGWVLAQYKARKARVLDLATLKSDVDKLKQKIGGV